MAIEYDKTGKLFQVDYQSPFGGIDSTAYASAINPQNFVAAANGYSEDNILRSFTMQQLAADPGSNAVSGNIIYIPLGSIQTDNIISLGVLIGYIITGTNVYSVVASPSTKTYIFTSVATYTPASGQFDSFPRYLVIDQVQTGKPQLFWTSNTWTEIWTYTLAGGAVLLTNYCGGGILGLLQNQLLNIGGYSAADGSTPNRFSWSAPGEYGQFQPYDVTSGTGNYAAGFNDIPSISDVLTGFAAIGTVGYLFRSQGITQINPTGNGVEPFQFNHLWASQLGIGTVYPLSICQYGSMVAFVTDVGIYTLGLAGLSEVGQSARTYVYNILRSIEGAIANSGSDFSDGIRAVLVPYIETSPELYYILSFQVIGTGANTALQLIGIRLSDGAVYNLGEPPFGANLNYYQLSWYYPSTIGLTTASPDVLNRVLQLLILAPDNSGNAVLYANDFDPAQVATFIFRKEQMKFGYIPTVTKIAVLGALIDPTSDGNISFSIDGGLNYGVRTGPSGETFGFPDIVIVAGVGNPGQGIIDNIYTDGVVSIQRPQLSIKLTNVQIAECWYQGTLADFPLI